MIYNIGINNIKNITQTKVYNTWKHMFMRCYNEPYKLKNPKYIGCSVDITWQHISNFITWYDKNYIEGYELDKDLFIPNNKIYSEYTCIFIPKYINYMITNHTNKNNRYMEGVSRPNNRYRAQISIYGKLVNMGTFDTEIGAHKAYIQAKINYYLNEADKWWNKNEKIAVGLYRHAEIFLGNNWKTSLDCI